MLHLHNYILIWIEKISQSYRLQLFEQPNKSPRFASPNDFFFTYICPGVASTIF